MENYLIVTAWQEFFSHTSLTNFRRPLHAVLMRYTAEYTVNLTFIFSFSSY